MDRKACLFVVLTSIAVGLTGLAACVGDEPSPAGSPTPDGDGGGGTDGPVTTDGPPSGTDAGTDASDAAPDPCAVTSGAFLASKTFPFVGTNHGVAGTSNGGYVFVGDFRSNNGSITYGDAGPISGSGNTMDAAVVRFNPDGTLKWQAHFGGTGSETFQGVTVDDKDDVYVAGYFTSPAFTIGTAFSNASQANLGIVAKLDGATGAPLWAHSFAPGYLGFGCSAIDFDSGRLVVSCTMGTTQTYDKGPSGATAVLQGGQPAGAAVYGLEPATGYVLWGLGLGATTADIATATNVYSVDVTPSGTVVAGVFSGGTLTAKQTNAITVAQVGTKSNGFVIELSASTTGALPLWAKGFGDATSAGDVYSVSAAGTSKTGIVVGGSFDGKIDFGGGPHATVGNLDAFAMMLLNKAGPPAWEKFFGGVSDDTIGRVRLDACGRAEALMLAHSALPVTDGVTIPAPQAAGEAAIVAKLEPVAGKLLWASGVTPGGSADLTGINNYDFGIDTRGNTLVVGDFRGTIDFGSGSPSAAVGGSDPYVLVYRP